MHHLSWPARAPASAWSRTARPPIDTSGRPSGAGPAIGRRFGPLLAD